MIKADDILLYITGHASRELRQRIKTWIAEDPANQAEFDLLSNLWDQSSSLNEIKILDTEKAWKNIEPLLIDDSGSKPVVHEVQINSKFDRKKIWISFFLIVLIIILLIAAFNIF